MAQIRTCIICERSAGSGEHIFPAALGGRRTNRGIYCSQHDNDFSPLVSTLATQLEFLNGQLEVVNDHRKKKRFTAPVVRAADGVEYAVSGPALIPQRMRILKKRNHASGREELQIAVPASMQERLKELKEKGDIEIYEQGEPISAIQSEGIPFRLMFGGARFLCGIAYVAMGYLAKFHPELARQSTTTLVSIKKSLLEAAAAKNDEDVRLPECVWWESPDALASLPISPFRFSHTVVVSTNAERQRAAAYICLFGAFCFGVDFGEFQGVENRTVLVHLDPQAPYPPKDQEEVDMPGVTLHIAAPQPSPTENLRKAIHDGTAAEYMQIFLKRVGTWHLEKAAQELLAVLGNLAPEKAETAIGRRVVQDLVDRHAQRIYQMMCIVAKDFPQHLAATVPEEVAVALTRVVENLVAPDESKITGLSDLANASLEVSKAFLGDAILKSFREGSLTLEKTMMLLNGGEGIAVVGHAMLTPILGKSA